MRFKGKTSRLQGVQLVLGDERIGFQRAIAPKLRIDKCQIGLECGALGFEVVVKQHQYGLARGDDVAALVWQFNHAACHLRRNHQVLRGTHRAAE